MLVIGSKPRAGTGEPAPIERPGSRRSGREDVIAYALLGLGLLVFFAELYPRRHWTFGVGPDGPVYLWWTRLAGLDGLSVVGTRPGAPALALVLRGTVRSSLVEAVAATAVAAGVSLGVAAAALVGLGSARSGARDRRLRYLAAGALAGTFAVHLADGYLANVVQAALFLGAAALLCAGTTRAAVAAAGLLAASALTHPAFFAVSAAILALTAILTLIRKPAGLPWRDVEGTRILWSVLGAGAVAGLGYLTMLWGPRPLRADTSEDAFLRRAGLGHVLRRQYRGRLYRHVPRYILFIQVPAAILGLFDTTGFLWRFLVSWVTVFAVGVTAAVTTSLFPGVRLFAFGYVLPILAGIGLVRAFRWGAKRNRVIAAIVALGLGVGIVSGAEIAWNDTQPYIPTRLLSAAALAGHVAARAVPPGTPLVFVVDTSEGNIGFFVTRAMNVIRDAVPPDRIRDVRVYVGSPDYYLRGLPTPSGAAERRTISALYMNDIRRAGGRPLAFVLAPANTEYFAVAKLDGDLVGPDVVALRPHPSLGSAPIATAPPPEAAPSSGWRLALFSAAALLVLFAIGFGWASAAVGGPAAVAIAPGAGMAAVILAGLILDRLGAPIGGWGAPAASGLAAGGGYLAMFLSRRRKLVQEPGPGDDAAAELAQQ